MGRHCRSAAANPRGRSLNTDLPFSQTWREELANAASHGLGCVLALAAMPVLAEQVQADQHPIRQLGVTVFITSMVLMYLVSAVYHALPVGQAKRWLRKCDHAVIFIFIAGSYTPFSMLGLSEETGRTVLVTMWVAAIVLGLSKMIGLRMPRWLMSLSYVAMGWFAAWSMPEASVALGTVGTVLLVVGGVLYTVGAVIFWRKAPNPVPGWFGYHEVFHLLVIAAGLVHFIAVAGLVFKPAG